MFALPPLAKGLQLAVHWFSQTLLGPQAGTLSRISSEVSAVSCFLLVQNLSQALAPAIQSQSSLCLAREASFKFLIQNFTST